MIREARPAIDPGHRNPRIGTVRRVLATLATGALIATLAPVASASAAGKDDERAENVTVMTRNIFLGGDLGPAIRATSLTEFADAVGVLKSQVDATSMRTRARGLAKEIRTRKPDIIGLQEAALWRTGPVDLAAVTEQRPAASTVYQDFVQILLDRVNRKKPLYRVVSVAEQFDFEAPANTDGDITTGVLPGVLGAEQALRLTMRDAILVRRNAGVQVRPGSVRTGQYTKANSFTVDVLGLVEVTSLRGWQRMNVKVRNSPWFRFANTHFEAFDDRTERPSIRARQAAEFTRAATRGQGRKPVVVLGDFNSDLPGLVPGDEQAYRTMLRAGFRDRGTTEPLSCCIQDSFDLRSGGSMSDWDHRVDQIMTNTPEQVATVRTWVTGRKQSFGTWHSDHAGVVAKLRISR